MLTMVHGFFVLAWSSKNAFSALVLFVCTYYIISNLMVPMFHQSGISLKDVSPMPWYPAKSLVEIFAADLTVHMTWLFCKSLKLVYAGRCYRYWWGPVLWWSLWFLLQSCRSWWKNCSCCWVRWWLQKVITRFWVISFRFDLTLSYMMQNNFSEWISCQPYMPAFDFVNVILAGKSLVQFWILFPWLTQSPS